MKITHKNQYNKENKMKKELLIGAAIFLPLISACTSVKPVAKSWSERLSEYQITPIFPPREDVYVGDVYLVPAIKQSPQQSTDSNSRDVPYGVLVDSLDLNQEITNFYNNRPSFVTEDLENGNPADAKFNIYKTNDLTRLKKVIFPDFLSSRFSDTGLSASIPVSYTHLDVYKRQPLFQSLAIGNIRLPVQNNTIKFFLINVIFVFVKSCCM